MTHELAWYKIKIVIYRRNDKNCIYTTFAYINFWINSFNAPFHVFKPLLQMTDLQQTEESFSAATNSQLCFVCGKEFRTRSGYRRHLRIHNDTEPYNCSICNKKFLERHHYEGHINKHHGMEPHKCPTCKATFAYKVSLARHLKTCKGPAQEPTFECRTCQQQFQSKDSLADHNRGKHRQSPAYKCEQCGKMFRWRSSRSKHLKAKHQWIILLENIIYEIK